MSARTAWWKRILPAPRWALISVPYLWLLLFFAIPFLIALKISFAKAAIAMPPFTDVLYWVDGFPVVKYGFVGGVTGSNGPVVVMLDGELGGDVLDLSQVRPVSITNVELCLAAAA